MIWRKSEEIYFLTNLARSAISWLAENRFPELLADWELRRFLIRELLLGMMLLLSKLLLLVAGDGGVVRMRRWTKGLLSCACSWLSSTLWVASIKLSLPGDIPRLKLHISLYFEKILKLIQRKFICHNQCLYLHKNTDFLKNRLFKIVIKFKS